MGFCRKIIPTGLFCVALAGLSGCDSTPDCDQDFVADYDQVADAMNAAHDNETSGNLAAAQAQVDDFDSQYSGTVCNAKLAKDGSPTTIDVDSDVSTWRGEISSARDALEANPPSSSGSLAQADPSTPLVELTGGFQLTVSSPTILQSESSADASTPSQVITNGAIVLASPAPSTPYCTLVLSTGVVLSQGEVLAFTTPTDANGTLTAQAPNANLNCTKPGQGGVSAASYTLADLNAIFGNMGYSTGYVEQ